MPKLNEQISIDRTMPAELGKFYYIEHSTFRENLYCLREILSQKNLRSIKVSVIYEKFVPCSNHNPFSRKTITLMSWFIMTFNHIFAL